ncbi:MAG TPA: hypothetical protein VG893_02700 [Terracidiphilus sp.]|nr:hypothetical protein [Terracidiphilus sp.]
MAAVLMAGCGDNYRPVVTPTNPSGPASQPNSLAVVVSSTGTDSPGIATVLDYSGDTVAATASIGPGPLSFTLDGSGSTGYTVNSDGTLTNFPASASQLQEKYITYSTLPTTANTVGLFSPSSGLWVADLTGNAIDVLTGSPETFKQAVPVAPTPVAVSGSSLSATRFFSISLNSTGTPVGSALGYDLSCNTAPSAVTQTGEADAIEVSGLTVTARIPLGKCPVYAVSSNDAKRLFVLNRGSDTITVINSQNATLDACTPFLNQNGQTVTCHPTLPLSTTAVTNTGITPPNGTTGMPAVAGPVYAEYNIATQQLVVADYDGGTISIIDVSLDEYGNDSATFGTTYTVKVGDTATPNPAAVTVLYDGSRAYTANQNDDVNGTGNGTVSIVNLSSHTVEKTLSVVGHPRTVVSTSNSLYGKVYVASPDSPYITILRTDQDIVDTTVPVQGNVIDVRTSTQNGVSGNAIIMSRRPGAGQPCYLPGPAPLASLQACQTLPE